MLPGGLDDERFGALRRGLRKVGFRPMAKRRAVTEGEVFVFPAQPDGWGACQVVRVEGSAVEVVTLDHASDTRPTLETVRLVPLEQHRFGYKGEIARCHVCDALPDDFVSLGVAPAVLPATPGSQIYAFWDGLRGDALYERRWLRLPEAVRTAYKAARPSVQVTLPLPTGPHTASQCVSSLHLAFGPAPPRDRIWLWAGEGASFDWRGLDVFPQLTHLGVCGDAPGALAWCAGHPLVQSLTWRGAGDTLDLSGHDLTQLELPAAGCARVVLSPGLRTLILALDPARPVEVVAADGGSGLALTVRVHDEADLAGLRGLDAVRKLTVEDFVSFDLRALGRWASLRDLELVGAPGRLSYSASLAERRGLEVLRLWNCVAVDADAMPPLSAWPALRKLRVWGLGAAEAAVLRGRWGRDRRLRLTGALDEAAVFARADIPMQRWPSSVLRMRVCTAYSRAAKSLVKPGLTEAKARRALAAYAAVLKREGPDLDAGQRRDLDAAWDRLVARAEAQVPGAGLRALPRAW